MIPRPSARRSTLTLLALAVGCTPPVKSSEVDTSDMTADLHVFCDGTSSTATAIFTLGSDAPVTYVELDADDTLTVSADAVPMDMQELSANDLIEYLAVFATVEENAEFVFSLERVVDDGAPTSVVTLPPAFTLDDLSAETLSAASDDITFSWTGDSAGDVLELSASGDCIEDYDAIVGADTGTTTLPAGTLQTLPDATSCTVTFTLARNRTGTLDPGYGEGSIDASQARTTTASISP